MPPKQDPLPVAPNRAALSNKIALLLSQRSTLLKPLTASHPSAPASRRVPDEELKGTRPNDGVGYEPEASTRSDANVDKLRGRMLGKRKVGEARKFVVESESDEEEGRGSLGRAKKRKTRVERGQEDAHDDHIRGNESSTKEKQVGDGIGEGIMSRGDDGAETAGVSMQSAKAKKKRKNRERNKKKMDS